MSKRKGGIVGDFHIEGLYLKLDENRREIDQLWVALADALLEIKELKTKLGNLRLPHSMPDLDGGF